MEVCPDKAEHAPLKLVWLQETLRQVSFITALRERSRIRRICREALWLYRQIETEMPEATHVARYARVIEKRTGADPSAVQRALRCAEESFAMWPVERTLTFRDVVTYLAVTDFLRTDIAVENVRSKVIDYSFAIVTKMIPTNL